MKRTDLEALLDRSRTSGTTRKHGHLVPVLVDLYRCGLTVKQLAAMFPVSAKWIRARFTEAKKAGFAFREPGPREAKEVPTVERIVAVLRKHGLKLDDLPGPRGKKP